MAIQIIDKRKAGNIIKFENLSVGQFFVGEDGKLGQKILDTTSENNVTLYQEGGLVLGRKYKEDAIMPVDIDLVIVKETDVVEVPAEEPATATKSEEAPTPAEVDGQPGINVVSINKDK